MTVGLSGGGPHALACAALLPHRVVAAVTLACIAPHDGPGLDFLADMGQGNVDEYTVAQTQGVDGMRRMFAEEASKLTTYTAAEYVDAMAPSSPRSTPRCCTDRWPDAVRAVSNRTAAGCRGLGRGCPRDFLYRPRGLRRRRHPRARARRAGTRRDGALRSRRLAGGEHSQRALAASQAKKSRARPHAVDAPHAGGARLARQRWNGAAQIADRSR